MEETYERTAARALGKYGEEMPGAVQPTTRMLQIWEQLAIPPQEPRFFVLYEKQGQWRKVPSGLLAQAVMEAGLAPADRSLSVNYDIHAALKLAMEITDGALQLLQVIDALLTKAGQ